MRTREEIEEVVKALDNSKHSEVVSTINSYLTVELLLDIRDLLLNSDGVNGPYSPTS